MLLFNNILLLFLLLESVISFSIYKLLFKFDLFNEILSFLPDLLDLLFYLLKFFLSSS
jgi:hypothetical protein